MSCRSAWRGQGRIDAEELSGKDCKGNCCCCGSEGPPLPTYLDTDCGSDGSAGKRASKRFARTRQHLQPAALHGLRVDA